MRVVIAVGGFGSVGSVGAARDLAAGWRAQAPHDIVEEFGSSDGSEGFVDALAAHHDRTATPVVVTGPAGDPVPASYVMTGHAGASGAVGESGQRRTAYIEAAQAAGRHLVASTDLDEPDRLTSAGVGELIQHARDSGAERIVVGCGDLASHDGGRGLLTALLDRAELDHAGPARAEPDRAALAAGLAAVRQQWRDVDLVLAHSTSLPLLGFHGASAALGTEHGVAAATTQRLEKRMGEWSDQVRRAVPEVTDLLTGQKLRRDRQPGAGVGGGIGYLLIALGARAVSGAHFVAEEIGLASRLRGALVITGQQIYDWRSVSDGVVADTAAAALEQASPTVVVADEINVGRREGMSLGIAGSYQRKAGEDLAGLAARVARTWSPPPAG